MVATVVMAQSNGDKLFMEGQSLQRTQTIASQNAAIKKFQAAKVVYSTADKKQMCENQIAICNSNISSIRRSSASKRSKPQVSEPAEPDFSLEQNQVEFEGGKNGSANVVVNAKTMDWTFSVPENVEGGGNFARVNRSNDGKSVDVEVDANPKTLERHQTVNVNYSGDTEVLTIVQKGKPVTLSTSTNLLEFGIKGGKESIEVYTNSDSTIVDNNNQTWYIESKPDWIDFSVEVNKKKGIFSKGLSAIKGLVSGSATAASATDVKIANVKIICMGINKYLPEFHTGRRGEIVFASQDQRYKLVVVQQP